MRSLEPTLDEYDQRLKIDVYFAYAEYDNSTVSAFERGNEVVTHTSKCQTYELCDIDADEGMEKSLPDNDDTLYVVKWLGTFW